MARVLCLRKDLNGSTGCMSSRAWRAYRNLIYFHEVDKGGRTAYNNCSGQFRRSAGDTTVGNGPLGQPQLGRHHRVSY